MPQVLVVDDSPRTRTVLGMALADAGYEVREASDGVQAIVELVQEPPDCMVLDLVMPRIGGLDVLRAMQEEGLATDTAVVVYSAEDSAGHVRRALDLGAAEFLVKPIDPFALVGMVGDVLATAGTTPRQACGAVSADRRPPAEAFRETVAVAAPAVTRPPAEALLESMAVAAPAMARRPAEAVLQGPEGTRADVVDLGAYRAAYAAS